MKAFTIFFEDSKKTEWREYYLNYGELKNLLQRFAERRSRASLFKSTHDIQRLTFPPGEEETQQKPSQHKPSRKKSFQQKPIRWKLNKSRSIGSSTIVSTVKRVEDNDFVLLDNQTPDALDANVSSIDTILEHVAQIEREEFCNALDKELDKVARFYLNQVRLIEKNIDLLQVKVDDGRHLLQASTIGENEERGHERNVAALIDQFTNEYQRIADELLELNLYVGANIIALRQILTRYDSMIRSLDGPPLGQWYIVTRRGIGVGYHNFQFEAFFIHHGLTLIADKLKLSLRKLEEQDPPSVDFRHSFRKRMSFRNLNASFRRINMSLRGRSFTEEHYPTKVEKPGLNIGNEESGVDRFIREISSEIATMEATIVKAEQRVDIAGRGRMAVTDSFIHTLRCYFLTGSAMNEMLLQPSIIRTRGVSLKKEMKYFAKWRSTYKIKFDRHRSLRPDDRNFKSFIKGPLLLNLVSQLLYMMNHYIIEPSSTKYIHTLGGNDAMSGLMISMAPWAALISALVYSLWSNKSFRQPLICSGFLLVIGSLMYASALKFGSIPLAMSGRFVSGLGAPCGINIRYIADTVPSVHRTGVSALFMTVSALGMSMGPGMAVLLDFLDLDFYIPIYGEVIINGMTGPGYLMFLLWLIYLFLLILIFKDGERIGLYEMAEKERLSHADSQYDPPISIISSGSTVMSDTDGLKIEDAVTTSEDGLSETLSHKDLNRVINQATVICMLLKFMGKFNLEVLNCSTSLMSSHRYDWTVKNIGLLGFVNGCLVMPITMFVGFLSQYYTDRKLLLCLLGVALLGVTLLFDPTDLFYVYDDVGYNSQNRWSVGPKRYIAGQIIEFCGFQASQSIVMSMLSKVVPLSLAKGTFNSGFITTALTTLARALGDVFITVMGLASLRQLLNLLVIPCVIITLASIYLSIMYRKKLTI